MLYLKLSSPDQPGNVAKIVNYIAAHGGNLLEFNQFTNSLQAKFFARVEMELRKLDCSVDDFINGFTPIANSIGATWQFRKCPFKIRTAILVTKTTHCLNEILWRVQHGDLPIEITSIIGNRDICKSIAEKEGIPFHYINMDDDKQAGFKQIANILHSEQVELGILARFMQILPDWFCNEFSGKLINIHHSFLPAFMGANPYRQAYDRGVKLIGATCHYVTSDLDAGPIIDQEVKKILHSHSPQDLMRIGRDCERIALARGIRYHVFDRTIIDGNRAIVFED